MTLGLRYITDLLFQSKQEIQFSRQESRKQLLEKNKTDTGEKGHWPEDLL